MLNLLAIATNTLKEAQRDRVLYVLLFFACLSTGAAALLSSLSIGQEVRILGDAGLFAIATIGGVIAVFLGTSLVTREIDQGTIYLLFTKPVPRWQFIAGKFLGLAVCLAVITALMGAFLTAVVFLLLPDRTAATVLLQAIAGSLLLIWVELLLVTATALFFSTFTSPLMSVLLTLCFWLIAHLSPSLLALGEMSTSSAMRGFLQAIYYGLPDLSALSRAQDELMRGYELARHASAHGVQLPFLAVPLRALPMVLTYILGYILLLLSVGTYITERREFN